MGNINHKYLYGNDYYCFQYSNGNCGCLLLLWRICIIISPLNCMTYSQSIILELFAERKTKIWTKGYLIQSELIVLFYENLKIMVGNQFEQIVVQWIQNIYYSKINCPHDLICGVLKDIISLDTRELNLREDNIIQQHSRTGISSFFLANFEMQSA